MDYDEENLRSVVDATARVGLKLDDLESFIDAKPKSRLRDPKMIESRETLESFNQEMTHEVSGSEERRTREERSDDSLLLQHNN